MNDTTKTDLLMLPAEGQVWVDGIDPVFWRVEEVANDMVRVRMLDAAGESTATEMNVAENRWRTFVERQAATLRAE